MVQEGCIYTNGILVRLIVLMCGNTVIYQECDKLHQPTGARKEGTVTEFNGWTLEREYAKRLDRQPGV